jgi:hypothetical protein
MAIAYNIKPTKYPMNPDDLSELFDEAIEIAKDGMQEELVSGTNIKTINGNSLLGSGDLTIESGGATPTGYYGQYQDGVTQTAATANTGYPIKFRTLDYSNGVTVVSDSRITIANTGIYNLQFSVQLENSSSNEHDATIWLRKNGTDVAGSAGFVSVASSHGGVHGHVLSAWNYLLDAVGRDYYELVWSVSNTAVTMPYYAGALPPPSAASAIFTVTQQAGIMAGTGMTALNGLTDAVQTISTGTTGSDFNVASSGTTHQFNLPTASATNRGALSTTDWTTFNGKQATLVSGTNIKTVNGNSLVGSGDVTIGGALFCSSATTVVTGTTNETLIASVPIPTTISNAMLRSSFTVRVTTLGAAAPRTRIRIGTFASPTLAQITASTILGTNAIGSTGMVSIYRTMPIIGGALGSIKAFATGTNANADYGQLAAFDVVPKDFTTQQYLYFTITNNTLTAVTESYGVLVEHIK